MPCKSVIDALHKFSKVRFKQAEKEMNFKSYFQIRKKYLLFYITIFILLFFINTNANAQCPTPPGNQTSYGDDQWIGYVYPSFTSTAVPPTDVFMTPYKGYITQPEKFDQNLGLNPLSGANLCGTYSNNFAIRYKLKQSFDAGYYNIVVGGDEGYRLSLDGGVTFAISNWGDHGYTTTTQSFYLQGNVNLVLEYYERSGNSRVSFSYEKCSNPSSTPRQILGTTSICGGNSTTLTAVGGVLRDGAFYEWGTGNTAGLNIISGENSESITVRPSVTTTYWVRRTDLLPCSYTTDAISQVVTVLSSTAPTAITGDKTICKSSSITLTASGGALGSTGVYQWGTETTLGSNILTGQTGISILVSPSISTTYWVRIVDSACSNPTAGVSQLITVSQPSVGGTVNTNQTICSGTQPSNLTLSGNTGSILSWQKASDATFTSPITIANTTSTLSGVTIGNLSSTTYFRAVVQNGACPVTYSSSVTITVTPSVGGTVSSNQTICSGSQPTSLTLSGNIGSVVSWQKASNATFTSPTIIASTSSTLSGATIGNLTSTTYFRAVVQNGVCSSTNSSFVTVTVNQPSLGGTVSSNQTICYGTQPTNLTLSGSTGSILSWQKASDATFTSPTTISSTSSTLSGVTIGNLSSTTYFRAVVKNGTCSAANSSSVMVTVTAPPTTATNNSSQTICTSGTVILAGNIPNIGIGTWSLISGPNTSLNQFDNTALPAASFTPTLAGTYVVRWSINNSCGASSYADATINVGEEITTTWNGNSWNNGMPNSASTAIITGNYTSTLNGGSIRACSLTVNNNAIVDIISGDNIILNGKLTVVDGSSLTIENNANLVQYSNVTNSGNIVVKRNSSALFRLDYTLWSSPVVDQNLSKFSPLTSISPSRFYTYDTSIDLYNPIATPSTSAFDLGKGYLIRMPNTWVAVGGTATSWTGTFTGVPNNGNISVTMSNAGKGYNAVGNPYPSALNFANFIFANKNNIEGTVYFWRKTNNSTNPISYSTCTTVGCTVNNTHTYKNPDLVSVGQGFIVKAKPGQTILNFTNAMRSSENVNQFFRSAPVDRFWLEFNNSSNVSFGKNLIAYIPDATLGYDNGLDGIFLNDSKTALVSMADDNEVVIQARPLFDAQDILPLVLKTDVADTYTISLEQVEGVFKGSQDIFLKDKLTNTFHDFKTGAYTFSTEAGRFDNRFEIVYQNPLAVQQASITNNTVVVYKQNNELVINSENIAMEDIKVFDIRGRLLVEKNKVNSTETKIDTSKFATQVLIVQITTENQIKIIKKIVN